MLHSPEAQSAYEPPALARSGSTSSTVSEPLTPSLLAIAPVAVKSYIGDALPELEATPFAQPAKHRRTSSQLSASLEASSGMIRSRSELEQMLQQAEDLIAQKEKELAVAASLGQSLLEHNNVLRGRHDSLAARLGVDKALSPAPPSMRFSPSIANFVNAAGGDGPSTKKPAPSRPPLRDVADWMNAAQSAPADTFTQSPRRRTRTRTRSSASGLPSVLGSPRMSEPASRSLSPVSRASSPLATLDLRNAELAAQLEDLQAETARADRVGKQKLRKLDRELAGLKEELAAALETNTELERKLNSSAPRTAAVRDVSADMLGADAKYAWPPRPNLSRESTAVPKSEDSGLLDRSPEKASFSGVMASDADQPPFLDGELSQELAPESMIVGQLLEKIKELENTNESITAHREELDERLGRAQVELDGLRKSYEDLEADLRREEAERLQQQPLKIEWREQPGSPPSPTKQRALGNKRIIERRKMSMTMSRQPSKQSLRHASSRASLRIVSASRRELRRKVSSASMFFGDDDAAAAADTEDVVDAVRREDSERRRRQYSSGLESDVATPVRDRGQKTLGSELGSLWGSPSGSHAALPLVTHPAPASSSDEEDYGVALQPPRLAGPPGRSPPRPDHRLHVPDVSVPGHADEDVFTTEDDLIPLGGLRDAQRPDEDTYDMLDRAASDLPIAWEDIGKQRVGWVAGPTYQGGFAYEDNSDNEAGSGDPWQEQGTQQLESAEAIKERQRIERRQEKRQERLRRVAESETASNAASEHSGYTGASSSRRAQALRRLGFRASDSEDDEDAEDYQHLQTRDYARRKRGTDYWPVDLRARYGPTMMVNRARTELASYLEFVTTWLHVFAVISLAIIYAVSKGPAVILGTGAPAPRRLRRNDR